MDSSSATSSSMRRFQKAMQVVNQLNVKIQDILQRYSINRDSINPACISSLHRRLTTMEAMRSLYLKYAMKKMRQTPVSFQLQVLDEDSIFGEGVSGDGDSEDEETYIENSEDDDSGDSDDSFAESDEESGSLEDDDCSTASVDLIAYPEYPSKKVDENEQKEKLPEVPDAPSPGKMVVRSKSDHDLVEEHGDLEVIVIPEEGEDTLDDLSDDELDLFAMEDISYRTRS